MVCFPRRGTIEVIVGMLTREAGGAAPEPPSSGAKDMLVAGPARDCTSINQVALAPGAADALLLATKTSICPVGTVSITGVVSAVSELVIVRVAE